MVRYRTGTTVRLRQPIRRNRWHKHGRARVRQGARGRVRSSSKHWRKGVRYDVGFVRFRRPERVVRSVPAGKLERVLPRATVAVLVLGSAYLLLTVGLAR